MRLSYEIIQETGFTVMFPFTAVRNQRHQQ